MNIRYINILGIHVSAVNMTSVLEVIEGWISSKGRFYVCVTGVYGIVESQRDSKLKMIYNRAGLATPDGMPTVWLGRLHGFEKMQRVYGPDLMLALCDPSLGKGYKHFLYGGGVGGADCLSDSLIKRFPGLQIVGVISPPFRQLTQDEDTEVINRINNAAPDIVWVGLGAPKQEIWMYDHRNQIDAPVMIGVGAAFDFLAGKKKQAPRWMQRNGLEWFYRLMSEPKRLWKRYLINNPLFIWYVVLQELGLKNFDLDDQ
jgi:N-acetylglucosaminyldiphosphoundecaprenol N-acetyl-beta-D-mannosaminyltransferase